MRNINVQPIQSIERAIAILNCFSFERSKLTIDEVMKKTGLSKATAYRMLWTMEKNGLIQYDPRENIYRLGYKMVEYGGIVLENLDIRREAEPYLHQLFEETQHTVLLAARQYDTLQYLLRYDSDEGFQPQSYVGRRRVLHYGAMGTVFMAYLPQKEAEQLIEKCPLERHTPYTLTEPKAYFKRLAQIRQDGYFVDVDETFVGFTAIAVPVKDATGQVAAVIGIAGPSFKLVGETRQKIIALAKKAAYEISRRLGFVGGRYYGTSNSV
jgi:DNA-binding IclR family transcriptional regulator